jgi:hypothetical protein
VVSFCIRAKEHRKSYFHIDKRKVRINKIGCFTLFRHQVNAPSVRLIKAPLFEIKATVDSIRTIKNFWVNFLLSKKEQENNCSKKLQ